MDPLPQSAAEAAAVLEGGAAAAPLHPGRGSAPRLERAVQCALEALAADEESPPLAPARGVAFGAVLGLLVWAALAAGLGALVTLAAR